MKDCVKCQKLYWDTNNTSNLYSLESFASRVASSQLKTLGLPELIANDYKNYEEIAIRLGNDVGYRMSIRYGYLKNSFLSHKLNFYIF